MDLYSKLRDAICEYEDSKTEEAASRLADVRAICVEHKGKIWLFRETRRIYAMYVAA